MRCEYSNLGKNFITISRPDLTIPTKMNKPKDRIKEVINKIEGNPYLARAVDAALSQPDAARAQEVKELKELVLSLQEAIEISGLSGKTIRKELKNGQLQGVLIGGQGGRWLIPKDALLAWLKVKQPDTRSDLAV